MQKSEIKNQKSKIKISLDPNSNSSPMSFFILSDNEQYPYLHLHVRSLLPSQGIPSNIGPLEDCPHPH
jgi:hypothetical protein